MGVNLRRWWTPTAPLVLENWREPCSGWRYPLVPVTRNLCEDAPVRLSWFLREYDRVHHDFDRDLYVYAWWPIAPLARVAYWWLRGTPLRWSIERWLNRRVADKRESEVYNFALLGFWRPLRAWTWRKTFPRQRWITASFG